jgi:hypothetical protein
MRKLPSLFLAPLILAATMSEPALADYWHDHGDIHYFHEHDYDAWRAGVWFHGFHDGRDGWWWRTGGLWYYYPAPIYPYPDPYTPPTVVVEQQAPAVVVAPGVAPTAPPTYVYYCGNPAGYYPYVPECPGGWQKVASTGAAPTQVAPAPVVSAPAPTGSERDSDSRKLHGFADEFEHVDLHSPHAKTTLKNLEKQIDAFRQSLYDRNYNAMDILRDAEKLQHRVAEQREKLGSAPVPPPQ